MTPSHLPAVDNRRRVRIWDREWNCLADERAQPDDKPSDLIERALKRLEMIEAHVTLDDTDGRHAGYAELQDQGMQIIDHDAVKRLTEWPTMP